MKASVLITTFCLLIAHTSLDAQVWTQKGSDIDGEAAGDQSGWTVGLSSDGDKVAIGAYTNGGTGTNAGHVRVYEWDGTAWVQMGADIDGEAAGDLSSTVSLSSDGNTVAIGAEQNDGNGNNSGHVRIHDWDGTAWTPRGPDIDGAAAFDIAGYSVSLSPSGDTVAIGSFGNDGNGNLSGHTRVFRWTGATWTQVGGAINGAAGGDHSGWSVSLSAGGNTIAITALRNGDGGANAGHMRVFEWNGTAWAQKGADIDGEGVDDELGIVSLSSDGNTVAVGAKHNDGNGTSAGHVRIYEWNTTAWVQRGTDLDGDAAGDQLGQAVCLNSDGSIVAAGAPYNDGKGIDAGRVQVFQWSGAIWNQLGANIDGEAAGDLFGRSVFLSADGGTIAIGGPRNDGSGADAGHVRVFTTDPLLPIELLSFTATWQDEQKNVVDLVWQTAQETNNEYFVVERSADAIHFEPILQQPGAGNSTVTLEYSDVDVSPITNQTSYYRLKQVDYDGSFTYSPIEVLEPENDLNLIALYPNPVGNQFTYLIYSSFAKDYKVEIVNGLGQTVLQEIGSIEEGVSQLELNTEKLSEGIYVFRLSTDTDAVQREIVK